MILSHYKPPRKDPKVDRDYQAFIRKQPCVVCQIWGLSRRRFGPVECAHVGARALGRKCSDRETLPLCVWHHRMSPQSYHAGVKEFFKFWKLDRFELIAEYNRRYDEESRNAA
jgi:hypothetical protein